MSRQAQERSDRKAGKYLKVMTCFQGRLYQATYGLPHDYGQIRYDCGSARPFCRHVSEKPPRQHRDYMRDRDEHAPTPRTTRTTSSQGSSGWKVDATSGIPGGNVHEIVRPKANANTPPESIRWLRKS